MGAIVATLVNVFTGLFSLLSDAWEMFAAWWQQLWGVVSLFFVSFFEALQWIMVLALGSGVEIQLFIMQRAIDLLPMMPLPPEQGDFSVIGQANRYIPLAELGGFLSILGTVYGAISLWKMAKWVVTR